MPQPPTYSLEELQRIVREQLPIADIELERFHNSVEAQKIETQRRQINLASAERRDRFNIARPLVGAFRLSIIVTLLYPAIFIIASRLSSLTFADALQYLEFLQQLITSAILPVITLVLGYYFGKDSAGRDHDDGPDSGATAP